MDILQKPCSLCKVIKSLDEFHNLKTGKYGKHSNCKECREKYRKKLSYNKPKNGRLKCCQCHLTRSVDEFYRDRSSSTGLQSYCKSCLKEKVYESQSKLEGYISKLLSNLQVQARKNNETITITKNDIIDIYENQNKKCALSDELLTYYSGPILTKNKYESRYNITISKINNLKPYTKENFHLLGYDIYKMKGSRDTEEFIRLCKIISEKNK